MIGCNWHFQGGSFPLSFWHMSVLRKEAAPQDWIRELMKLADVNSNKKGGGGTSEFRDLQTRVIEMAPEMWKARIRDVPFLAKTKGIHGAAIDDIVDEILQGSSEAEPQPIQDVAEAGVSVDPVLAPAVSVKEPLEEKMADAAGCQECLVAAEGVAESLRDTTETPPKVQVKAGEAAEPEPKKPRMMMKLGLWRFRLTGWFGGGGGSGGGGGGGGGGGLLHCDMCAAVPVKHQFAVSMTCKLFAILSCCRSLTEDTDSWAQPW